MPQLALEVFQTRLSCTCDLLHSFAQLSDETLRQMKPTTAPAQILSRYHKLIQTMRQLALDAGKLSGSAAKITPQDSVMLQ